MRQNVKHRLRNYRVREKLKVTLKDLNTVTKNETKENAEKILKEAYKLIDTASKKNIIHPNNANRKKSNMARLVAQMGAKKAEVAPKAKGTKKAVVAKEEPKEEVIEA